MLLVVHVTTAQAGNIFIGGPGSNWNTPANWWPDPALPGTEDVVLQNPTSGANPIVNSHVPEIGWYRPGHAGFTVGLDVFAGGHLHALYEATLGYESETTVTVNVFGGIFSTGGQIAVGSSAQNDSTGILNISGGYVASGSNTTVAWNPGTVGTITITDGTLSVGDSLWISVYSSGGIFNLENGNVTVTNNTILGWQQPCEGILNISGGMLSTGGLWVGYDGFGKVNISGGVLDVDELAFGFGPGFNGDGVINITDSGIITWQGDRRDYVKQFAFIGEIVSYEGAGKVNYAYNSQTGKTEIWAEPPYNRMDFNRDGIVDILDLFRLADAWLVPY